MVSKNSKTKVLVAMSGGVDSSVAAALLVRAGYDVTGMFAVNYDNNIQPNQPINQSTNQPSCWHGDYQDALRVAAKLGIPLLRWDFTREYRRDVLDYMYREYRVGRTPNPDVLCNKYVKFGAWLDRAKKSGFDYIATGHYARVERSKDKGIRNKRVGKLLFTPYSLILSRDTNKDQTYFLHQLSQDQLARTMFPLGQYTKPQVRKLAKKFDLSTADKEESMGICFVGEVPMREFLQKEIKLCSGDIVLSDGMKVGSHDGLAFYTIGERVSLKFPISNFPIAGSQPVFPIKFQFPNSKPTSDNNMRPMFVVDKNIKLNQLVVGHDDDPLLFKKEIKVTDVNWISGQAQKFPLKCKVRLRHRQPLQQCVICHPDESRDPNATVGTGRDLSVRFTTPQRAVTPGQFAVFYGARRSSKGAKADINKECLGGGVVE